MSAASKDTVSCIMLTGLPGRKKIAQVAVRAFLDQDYPHKELLIVNTSRNEPWEYDLFYKSIAEQHPQLPAGVTEISLPRPDKERVTTGHLRNLAMAVATGDWMMVWDDDDWSHPQRLSALMERRKPGRAVVPTCHVRYHFPTNTAYCWSTKPRWNPSIHMMLFPRVQHQYPGLNVGEDTYFLEKLSDRMDFWDNRKFAHH